MKMGWKLNQYTFSLEKSSHIWFWYYDIIINIPLLRRYNNHIAYYDFFYFFSKNGQLSMKIRTRLDWEQGK